MTPTPDTALVKQEDRTPEEIQASELPPEVDEATIVEVAKLLGWDLSKLDLSNGYIKTSDALNSIAQLYTADLTRPPATPSAGVSREAIDALSKAFCLLDTFAGEGLGHTYGNGQTIDADDTVVELTRAFGMEAEPGWWRDLPLALIPEQPPTAAAETAGLVEAAVNQNAAMRQELATVGNLVSDLARAMGVDQADEDGGWPDLAGRVRKLVVAAHEARHVGT